ncbi:hypothetical protein NHG31_08405, partial [Aerococcaceae bacterium NML171108]|nr:hypothetical protein [Aerococcaceae bacterium NML171108]
MNEFKILLIDDENEQEEQLKEAVISLNKKHFINGAIDILNIDMKKTAELNLLNSKEDVYNQLKREVEYADCIDKIKKLYDSNITYKTANTPDDAILLLYKEHFHALIVDLMLEPDDSIKDNENYSGNVLLKNIIEKEIIPITVRTGFPDKITQEHNNNNLIDKCSKEHPTLEVVIENLIKSYENSIFSMFGSRGKVDEDIKEFFWDILPKCFINKQQEIADLDKEIQEKVIIRYVSSWLNNKYMFDE